MPNTSMPLRQVGLAGNIGAGGDQRLVQHLDELIGHVGARLAQRQASGIAGDLQGNLGGRRHDDGERTGPEAARQDGRSGCSTRRPAPPPSCVPQTRMGRERCGSRPLAWNTWVTARRLNGSATSVYSASVGMATTLAAAHGGGGPLQRFRLGLLRIDLDQVGCHVIGLSSARSDGLGHVQRHLIAAKRRA